MRLFKRKIFIIPLIVLALLATVGVFQMVVTKDKKIKTADVYYCPMHPSYTASRPGDCPICNMKLVKREAKDAEPLPQKTKTLKDICFLHNCPMLKEGKTCPMLVVGKPGEEVSCPVCGTHIAGTTDMPARKILYWTDPMLPGYKSDKPGKSPMGMELVPVYEEAKGPEDISTSAQPEGYATIFVTPEKQQLIGVKTAPAMMHSMTKTIRTIGRIAYDPELYQVEEEYIQASRALKKAEGGTIPEVIEQASRLVESSRIRLRLLGLSDELIDELATKEKPDQSLLFQDPEDRVWVYVSIYEFELPLVKVGQPINIEVQTIPGKTLQGIVRSIDTVLDPATRSAKARAVLTDSERLLKPHMFVNASIIVELGNVLAVPEEAVFITGLKHIIFVDRGNGIFEPRDVVVGVKADGYYQLKEGVVEGEKVVTSGNFLIDSESRLKGALESMKGR